MKTLKVIYRYVNNNLPIELRNLFIGNTNIQENVMGTDPRSEFRGEVGVFLMQVLEIKKMWVFFIGHLLDFEKNWV